MILKYLKEGTWGYIDHVRQVGHIDIDCNELIAKYDKCPEYKDVTHSGENDIASYMNGEKLPDNVAMSNKAFVMALNNIDSNISGSGFHAENLLYPERVEQNYPASVILLYLNDHREYETLALVTNEKAYLMNDEGKTIERLV